MAGGGFVGRSQEWGDNMGCVKGTAAFVLLVTVYVWMGWRIKPSNESALLYLLPLFVVIWGNYLISMLFNKVTNREKENSKEIETVEPSIEPDTPIAFGYKCSWLAVPSDNTKGIAETIHLEEVRKSNWYSGLSYENPPYSLSSSRAFLTPPINGWTLIVLNDVELDHGLEQAYLRLSIEFGECQFFGSYRVVDFVEWARAISGKTVRRFSYAGGAGGYLVNDGEPTDAELELGFANLVGKTVDELNSGDDWDDESYRWPDESDPALLAGKWSVNPLNLDQVDDTGVGLLGLFLAKENNP